MSKKLFSLPSPNYKIIGHRGIAGLAPENTLAGFRKAKQLGLNWVEFDAQPCLSGEWIIFHDSTIDRTTNGKGKVEELTLEELHRFDCGFKFDPIFTDLKIPLLSETLQELNWLDMHPNIDVKVEFKDFKDLKKAVKDFLNQIHLHWPTAKAHPLISSFNLAFLIELKKIAPEFPVGYLVEFGENHLGENHPKVPNIHKMHMEKNIKDIVKIIKKYDFDCLHCDYPCLTNHEISLLHEQNIPILVYTVNELDLAQELLQKNIFALFSDYPNKIVI